MVFKGVLSLDLPTHLCTCLCFCKWNKIGYLNKQFAEELISIDLPTFYHNALDIHLPNISTISLATRPSSKFRGKSCTAPIFFASERILRRSRFSHTAGSKVFGRSSLLRRLMFGIRKEKPKTIVYVGVLMKKAPSVYEQEQAEEDTKLIQALLTLLSSTTSITDQSRCTDGQ